MSRSRPKSWKTLYSVCVQGTREITRWILGYGGEVEVLEPESLRAAVAAQGRRMAAMYVG